MGVKSPLKTSQKLDLISAAFQGRPLRAVLETMTTEELVEAHNFLWDKLVEVHYLTQERDFDREEVTNQMIPSASYQKQQNCDLRLDYCKGVECIWSNPECAGNKVRGNMEVMAKVIAGYLDGISNGSRPSSVEDVLQPAASAR